VIFDGSGLGSTRFIFPTPDELALTGLLILIRPPIWTDLGIMVEIVTDPCKGLSSTWTVVPSNEKKVTGIVAGLS